MFVKPSGNWFYLLVDEDVFIAFPIWIGEIQLDLPQIGPLLEKFSFNCKLFSLSGFPLSDHGHDFSRLLEFLSELLELLSTMGISASSLPNLSDFPSSKADIGVSIVGIGACLKLESVSRKTRPTLIGRRGYLEPCYQGSVASFQSSGFPVLVDFSSILPRIIPKVIIQGAFNFFIRKNRRTIYSSVWLLHLSRFFEAVHNLFELIFRALGGSILFRVH